MPHKVEAWKCDYCNKVTISAGSTAAHEAYCKKNPNNRYCQTCEKCYYEHVVEENWGHDVMWCKQYNKPIHEKPYFEECDMQDEYYGRESYPIPCTCHEYERRSFVFEKGAQP